jgi:hypothetical protein
MAASDFDIVVSERGFVTLRVSQGGKPVAEWEMGPKELARLVARLLREEQRAATKRPQGEETKELEREQVADADAMGFARPPVPDQAIITMRFGAALLGFMLPLQTLGLTIDEIYRRTRRSSGRQGPPEDPTRH